MLVDERKKTNNFRGQKICGRGRRMWTEKFERICLNQTARMLNTRIALSIIRLLTRWTALSNREDEQITQHDDQILVAPRPRGSRRVHTTLQCVADPRLHSHARDILAVIYNDYSKSNAASKTTDALHNPALIASSHRCALRWGTTNTTRKMWATRCNDSTKHVLLLHVRSGPFGPRGVESTPHINASPIPPAHPTGHPTTPARAPQSSLLDRDFSGPSSRLCPVPAL